jgi:predicted phage gp36 major capsid-like protein
MSYTKEQLNALRQSLQTFVDESAEEAARAKSGKSTEKDYENLAQAYLAFRQWAKGWLKETK